MGHSHAHGPLDVPHRPVLATAIAVAVAVVAGAALAAMWALWPSDVPAAEDPFGGSNVALVDARVTEAIEGPCGDNSIDTYDGLPTSQICQTITVELADGGTAEFIADPSQLFGRTLSEGDRIEALEVNVEGEDPVYSFNDFDRSLPVLWLAIAFAVLVCIVARWRGLFALVGIGVTLTILLAFILPGFLSGKPPMAVAVSGSTVIMIVVLYLAHGISIRTSAALFGTFFGIVATGLLGAWATGWAMLTEVATEENILLNSIAPEMSFTGVIAATMIIAGLGVLNDVTITQASAVWELRAAQPTASRRELFVSAMRIGRDHIASSVYTLVFAYAGSAIVILLLITAYDQSLVRMATTSEIAQEIVRTLVGAIGLVLAVPMTTAIAAVLAPDEDLTQTHRAKA